MLGFWHSDNHTRSYKWWLQKCHWWDQWKHISNGDNDRGWRFGSSLGSPHSTLCSALADAGSDVYTQMMKHHCGCVLLPIAVVVVAEGVVVVPSGRMFAPINIHLMWSWKLVKTKSWNEKEEAAASASYLCQQEIWVAIIVLTFNYGSPLNILFHLTSHDTDSITSRRNLFFASFDSVK